MEFDYEDEKIGAGIITLSVLHFISSAFIILSGILILSAGQIDGLQEELKELNAQINVSLVIFEFFILRFLLIISLILILNRNKIGIYGYYLFALITLICNIAANGFDILSIIISLIFPILMGIFISKKKSIFGF